MAKKSETKALHLQKAPTSKAWGARKFGLRAWPPDSDQNESTKLKWLHKHLGDFHNSKKAINLLNLVKHFACEDGMDFLSASNQALLPYDHAEFLLATAKVWTEENEDYWGSKVLVLTGYLICQAKVCAAKEIVTIVKECCNSEEVDEEQLSRQLPFCHEGFLATKSVDEMKRHLKHLDFSELADLEAKITLNVNMLFEGTQTEMTFNALINLNTALQLSLGKNHCRSIRLKHNGSRVFLSSAGKKTLSQLGMKDNDVLEIEDCRDTVLQQSTKVVDSKANTQATRKKKNDKKKNNKKKTKKN